MVFLYSDGIKIRKLKLLRERQDPTSESSTRIAGSSNPSMSPIPEASGSSILSSGLDEENSNGKKFRESDENNSDEEQNSRKRTNLTNKKLTYSNGDYARKSWFTMTVPLLGCGDTPSVLNTL